MKISDLAHSDYIVYVDESGDPSLVSIDEGLPAAELNLQISIKSYLILHRYSCQWKVQEKIFPNK